MFTILLKFKGLLATYSISTSYLTSKELVNFAIILITIVMYNIFYWSVLVINTFSNVI